MPKKIRVNARTLRYGNLQMGRGGEYTVDDYFAKEHELDGSVEVLQDLGEDETSKLPAKVIDYKFLSLVKTHAPEIMEILESVFKERHEAEMESERAARSNEINREVEANQPPAVDDVPSEKTEETSTSSEKLSPIDELGGTGTTDNDSNNVQSTPIPQDFPGFPALTKKGITTMEALRQMGYDQLIEAGIKQATANQIGAKLMEMENNA